MVAEIRTADEFQQVLQSPGLVAIKFYADWCGPCKMMTPVFAELAERHPNVVARSVDVEADALQELCEQSGIQSLPTFRFYRAGTLVATVLGANKQKVEAAFNM
ncbi:MAG: uncharacterized protein KVP18_002051 [Porospora cf. gigantea A]|uniref:uncharacterized protein n=1 Tax=Porospora cf. gigantea A TaxID=2853593 RepID=UPI00355AA40B|nr:MAG: hypothetical protein KVP18_002051 [Porospora cf. gigantea A]